MNPWVTYRCPKCDQVFTQRRATYVLCPCEAARTEPTYTRCQLIEEEEGDDADELRPGSGH